MRKTTCRSRLAFITGILIFCIILSINSYESDALICAYSNSPQLDIKYNHVLYEGTGYYYKPSLGGSINSSYFSFAKINSTIANFYLTPDTGEINFTPDDADVGQHKLLIAVVNEENCFDAAIIEIKVYDKPKIINYIPVKSAVFTDETRPVLFNASVEDRDNTTIKYKWYLDDVLVSSNSSYTYYPNYTSSGQYYVKLIAENIYRLNDTKKWDLNVKEFNRAPILLHNIPDLVFLQNDDISPFALDDYFMDPDGDQLSYTYSFISFMDASSKSEDGIAIEIDNSSNVRFVPEQEWYGKKYLYFYASDTLGNSTKSNLANLRVIEEVNQTIQFDIPDCMQKNCSSWSGCLITNISIRECLIFNLCENKSFNAPTYETEACFYNASCFDGLKNGNETGVDCGGSCIPCPNCSDNIKNQGEFDIDCGGPCAPCPDCFNQIKDTKETDIDCGGLFCKKCGTYQSCRVDLDCADYKCINYSCAPASCDDGLKNGNETGVDCGGPCQKCPTCDDGIQNQDEKNIDCGGKKCKPCPSCVDGIKNSGEIFADCYGPCKGCNYLNLLRRNSIFIVIAFLSIFIIFMLLLNRINNLYILTKINRFFLLFRFRRELNVDSVAISSETIRKLESLQLRLHKEDIKSLTAAYSDIISWYYSSLFKMPESFIANSLYHEIKMSGLGYLTKIILIKFYSKSSMVHHDSLKFEILFNQVIEESKFAINGLKNAY